MPTLFHDKVIANGVVFNDTLQYPPEVDDWTFDKLDGWDETAELNVVSTPIGVDVDGEVTGEFFAFKARYLLASGAVVANSRAEAETVKDLIFRDAFPRNTDIILQRYEATPKQLTVRVSGKKEIIQVGPKTFRWVVPLMAADPLKYALTEVEYEAGVSGLSSGGRTYPRTYPLEYITTVSGSDNVANVVNQGTAASVPRVLIYGPLQKGGWRLSNDTTGYYIKFDIGVSATDVLEIDFKNEVAYLNGYPVTSTLSGDFWRVNPGANQIRLYADYDPDTYVELLHRSSWE